MSLVKEKDSSFISKEPSVGVSASEEVSESGEDVNKIIEWVNQLKDPNLRMNSLIQLSKKRESFADLATYLWYTPGVICIL